MCSRGYGATVWNSHTFLEVLKIGMAILEKCSPVLILKVYH